MEVSGSSTKTDSFSIANLLSSSTAPKPNVYRHSFNVNDDPLSHLRKLTLPETMESSPGVLMAGTSGNIHAHHPYGHPFFGAGGLVPHHHHVGHQIPPGHMEQFKMEDGHLSNAQQGSSSAQANEVASVESADSGKDKISKKHL